LELSTEKALLVIDHKQKVLPMSYREGQVEYFGKRGMSLLGAMLVRRVVRDGKVGLEYVFFDCIVERYSSQDNMQVLGVLTSLLPKIKQLYPEITEISIQSDNASCLASHDNIAYIHHLNKTLEGLGMTVVQWIYNEAQTGKGRLDTHFSFVNIIFRSYIESENNILTEQDIYDALCHNGGLMGSIALLVDGSEAGMNEDAENTESKKKKVCVLLKPFKAKTGVRETHEIQWKKGEGAYVYTLSGLTEPEHVTHARLEKFEKINLKMPILKLNQSSRPALFLSVDGENAVRDTAAGGATGSDEAIPADQKARGFDQALAVSGVEYGEPQVESQDDFYTTTETCALLDNGWACYKSSKSLPPMRLATLQTLKDLFDLGNKVKSKRISADRAHAIVMEGVAADDWHEKLIVTVARVKAFFGYTKDKQNKLIRLAKAPSGLPIEETSEDIEEAELDQARDLNAAAEEEEDAPIEGLAEHETDGCAEHETDGCA
jgi:hypothetical protein